MGTKEEAQAEWNRREAEAHSQGKPWPPVMEVRETIMWREYRCLHSGDLLHREHAVKALLKDATDWIGLVLSSHVQRIKCAIAFRLLKQVGDQCPYCNHLITFNETGMVRAFPEQETNP